MAGYLTTHVLNTAQGCPGSGIQICLYEITGDSRTLLKEVTSNADGRTDEPILPEEAFKTGVYELVFHVGAYFDKLGIELPDPKFLDVVPIRFAMAEEAHYHVPLLISPFGYSTYRGS